MKYVPHSLHQGRCSEAYFLLQNLAAGPSQNLNDVTINSSLEKLTDKLHTKAENSGGKPNANASGELEGTGDTAQHRKQLDFVEVNKLLEELVKMTSPQSSTEAKRMCIFLSQRFVSHLIWCTSPQPQSSKARLMTSVSAYLPNIGDVSGL